VKPPLGPVYPALHLQSFSSLLPGRRVVESAGQRAQLVLALYGAYVPAGQRTHSADPTLAGFI
jgi:hypothetical protein